MYAKQLGDILSNCCPVSMIVGKQKHLPPFLIHILVEKYTSMISRDYLKRLKAKAVNSLINFSTRNSIKAVK